MALAWWWSRLRTTAAVWRPLLLLFLLQQTLSPGSLLVHGLPSCPQSCSCQAAKEVHCTFRHLTSIPKIFPTDTERVNLGYNSLTEVEGSEFRSLRKLEMLMLHGNDISAVHSGAFYTLRSLQILKMSYNKLTSVNAELFQGLVGLVRLHLDHNLISFIEPYSFSRLTSLKLLQLEGNVLRDLHPHTFITLSLLGTFWSSGLRHLHLSDNLLEQLSAAVLQTAPKLEVLSLHGNPWSCDCQLQWLLDWNSRHEGVVKCKKERGAAETCAQCSSPRPLNASLLLQLTPDQLSCQRPLLTSSLKQWDSPLWAESEAEPDLPYTRDLEGPLGHLTFVLSDSHGNSAHVLCNVQRPGEGAAMAWSEKPGALGEVSVNVSLTTVLQCEIDREALQNLWRLVAYYYESPAILERGAPRDNANSTTYQYAQAVNENSPYFTDLKGYLTAEPGWLLQHRVTLQLNRRQTTNKNLVLDFSTLISEVINTRPRQGDRHGDLASSWALIRRGTAGQVQSVREGAKAQLECDVISSGSDVKVEWMHPDLSIIEGIDGKSELSESGQLIILNATLSDAGLYHCLVKTQAGIDLVPMRLTVKQHSLSPTAFNGEKMSIKKGQTLSLPCNVTTVEPSRTIWYLPKNRILLPTQQARKAEVLANGTLVVKKMTQDESGEYSCMASNIYGVDMISHLVEVTEEQKSNEQKEVGPTILVTGEEEGEGSGVDYQEIKRPFATQSPKRVGTQRRFPGGVLKRKRIKDPDRKPYKSVKELDPNHWAEILAKVNAKANTHSPTMHTESGVGWLTTELAKTSTPRRTYTDAPSTTTTTSTSTTTTTTTTTAAAAFISTTMSVTTTDATNLIMPDITTEQTATESYSSEREQTRNKELVHPEKKQSVLRPVVRRPVLRPTSSKVPSVRVNERISDITDSRTTAPTTAATSQPNRQAGGRGVGERTRTSPRWPNRRRPPHRHRNPSMRRLHPHLNPSHHSVSDPQTTVTLATMPATTTPTTRPTTTTTRPTTTTTRPTTTTTRPTTTTTRPTTTRPTTTRPTTTTTRPTTTTTRPTTTTTRPTTTTTSTTTMAQTTGRDDQTEDEEDYDSAGDDYKDSDYLDEKEIEMISKRPSLTKTTTPKMEVDSKVVSSSSRYHLLNPKTISEPKPDNVPRPTEMTVENSNTDSMGANGRHEEEIKLTEYKASEKTRIEEENKDRGKANPNRVMQGHRTHGTIHQTNQNRPTSHHKSHSPSQENDPTVLHTGRGTTREETKHKAEEGDSEKSHTKPSQVFPRWEPIHPWLQKPSQPGGQPPTSFENHNSNGKQSKENVLKEGGRIEAKADRQGNTEKAQPPRNPPSPNWPSLHPHHHHHQQHHHVLHPSGPGQRSAPRPRKGPGLYPFPTYRPWAVVTNRPEITADTARPTASWNTKSQPATSPESVFNHHHHHPGAGGWSHPNPGSDTQTRDHLMFSKLRNRYRQAQLDRIAQLGRRVTPPITPKPHVITRHHPSSSGNYRPHLLPLFKPYTPNPPLNVPSTVKPIQPAIPPFSSTFDLSPTLWPRPNTTPVLLYGSRWPSGGRISSRRPTVVPPFPGLLDARGGGAGYKPHITTATTTSVSVVAESDVYLPCKVSGNPAPSISWTKVSTGASIPAGTKHGLRFEVLKNGTFVIKNVQLQDRGQYLCTARNSFGSDRLVITLAVQTEAPKIQPPKSREMAVYLGRDVHLHCLTSGKPPAKISWILPNRTLVRDVGYAQTPQLQVSLLPNGTLHIQSANFSSKGDYKCIASNAAGADTVTYNLHVAALPPSISQGPSETIHVQPGMSAYVHCSAKGEPEPVLKWTIPAGVHVKPSQFLGRRLFVFPNGTLYVRNVALADGGSYECSAKNAVGIAKRTVQLVVRAEAAAFPPPPPPTAALLPRPHDHQAVPRPSQQHLVSAMYGSTVFLHCPESTGSTRGTIWQLPSKTIMEHQYSPDRSITVFRNGTLRILHLTELDGGNYLCLFQRPNGEDMELFQVDVLMTPPKIEHLRPTQPHVTYGQNFQVDCVATGLPNPEVSWSLPDGTVINNALQSDDSGVRNRRFVIFGNGTLLLQQMGKKDEGDYTCYAKNKLGKDERKVKVTVTPNAPKIRSESHSLATARLGESAKFVCQATGEPRPRILWISPGHHIISASSDRYQVMENGILVVKRVTLADEGKYTCIARNPVGEDVKNFQMEVESQEPSINGIKGRSTSRVLAVSYQTTQLDCKAEANPEPRVSWITPYGQQLPTPYLGGRFQVHPNGSLELRGVRKTDGGRYACMAKNTRGEATFWVELEVASLAEKPSFAVPNIEILPIKQDSREIILECPARGKPHPEFAWILPNRTMLPPGRALQRFVHHLGNGTLRISQPVASDKGVYRCVAKNVAGQAEKRYTLEAGRKPVIRGITGGMKITYGHSLFLPCSVDDWQQASISWTLPNGRLLDKPQHAGRVTFFANGTLQLKEVATFDKGTYICKASNTFGSHTLSYPVTVMVFPPRITKAPASVTRIHRGSPVTLGCVASGIPKPEISWTLPGRTTLVPHSRFTVQGGIHMMEDGSLVIQNPMLTNSGIYKCNAKNALGTDFKSTYLQVI